MANHGGSSSPDIHCVFVETNLDTRLALLVRNDENIFDFKEMFCKEHKKIFPDVGEIYVSALKVRRRRQFFYLPDSMNMISKAFEGIRTNWFMYVDAVRVEKNELLAIMDVDQNCSNPELLDKKKEIASDSALEEGLKTKVKKTKKRKLESSDGKKSRKKSAIDINQSAIAMTTSRYDVAESKVQVEFVASESCMGAIGKDIESGEKNDISMEDNQQNSEADRLSQEKILSVNSELVDGHTRGEVKDVEANQTLKEALETGLEKGEKTAELVMIDQEKNLLPTLDTSRDDVNESYEKLDGFLSGPREKDNGRGEGIRLAPSAVANLQTAELVTYPENQLEGSSNLTTDPATEKKKKRKKSSKDIVNVDPISRRETLGNPLVEAIQKENGMGEKSVEDVGRDKIETDNLASHLANHLDTNSGLTTSPVTEKKKKRKKSSKDHINQFSAAAATTTSREVVNEINRVSGNVDRVDATPDSFPISRRGNLDNPFAEARQKENEMGEKIDDDVGSGKAIPTAADNIQTDNFVSDPENRLEASHVLTTGPSTEKKRKHKKSSKDQINQSTAATTTSREIVNERETVSGSIDRVDVTSESFPHSRGEKLADTLVGAIQNENEMDDKFADLASTPVQETKMLDHIEKFKNENRTREHEIAKDNGETNAGEAKSVKSTKKKKSKIARTPAKEDTLVASGAQNVEPIIKAVDGEEPGNVIRDVLDSLQQKHETEENLGKIGRKSSKKSKKKDSLNIVEPQVLSVEVNNTAPKEVPIIIIPKDTDALFTPAKKDTESHLKKSIKVADKTDDNNPSKLILQEHADMGDNFDSSQKDIIFGGGKKQDQVTGGIKSIKEKKNLDLHPSGSIDGSLSSMKPKERKSRVQPASSGTSSHLQSRVKNDHNNGSKVDRFDASMKVAVNNKKEAVKKSSNSVTVNKSTLNFFKDTEMDSTEDESSKTPSYVSTKSPSDSSSDDDSDVTSMSRKHGNNLAGGTNRCSGSLQDIVRSSRSFKMAKLRVSQSQPDVFDDDSPTLDWVPDSQAN